MASTAAGAGAEPREEGPVLSVISKRLRALRKKLNRISQMEESMSTGKPLNKEQEIVLKSKPSLVAAIDELEKLRSPLCSAIEEELSQSQSQPETQRETHLQTQPAPERVSAMEDLLKLLYFGRLFDVKPQGEFTATMLTRTHERGCCLTYDYVTDDATDLLGEQDLDCISLLSSLLVSRPTNSGLSHKNALQQCLDHARLWLSNSDQPIEPNSTISYADLREKVNKIMASDYFTAMPEMKGPVEMVAAAGNYVPFQGPVPGVSMSVPVQMDDVPSVGHYQVENVDPPEDTHHQEPTDDDASLAEDIQKEGGEVENHVKFESDNLEAMNLQDLENNPREYDSREHYGNSRRNYQNQNHRGSRALGGRRGYSNGRGGRIAGRGPGGGYNNGRSQYNEQPGSYYPRNYYNSRGRGGREGVQNMQ